MTIALSIVLTIVTLGAALGIGLIFRRLLIRRLAKTVLDNWIIQTLGVIVTLIPLIIASFGIPLIWQPLLIFYYWEVLKQQSGFGNVSFTTLGINLIKTILLLVLGIGTARTVQRLTIRGLGENRIDINIRTLIGRVFYFIILTFAIFWILSIWEVSIAVPVTVISVLTVAVTLSIQDILKDLVAGFYILVERPFHIGDQISTVNTITYVGIVQDIQLRATKLRLVSGEEVTIPNSLMFGSIVVNNTFYGERRATLTATLPQEEYVKDETADKILSAIKELKHVTAKPEPTLFLSNYTASTVTLTIRFWINLGELSTVSDVMYTLHKTLPNAELDVKESAGDV
ncbi:MAG: mechanosensitive ion channel family protein [Ktedonobacteraceae bacterium]